MLFFLTPTLLRRRPHSSKLYLKVYMISIGLAKINPPPPRDDPSTNSFNVTAK